MPSLDQILETVYWVIGATSMYIALLIGSLFMK